MHDTVAGQAAIAGQEWTAALDEERRLLRHVPDEVGFAAKPQLAAAVPAVTRARTTKHGGSASNLTDPFAGSRLQKAGQRFTSKC